MGISFLDGDSNKQLGHGIRQKVIESHVDVYILYTKDIFRQLQANVLSGVVQLSNTVELHWQLEFKQWWLQLRGKPKTRCLAAAEEAPLRLNVEIQDTCNAVLFLSEIMQTDWAQ